jgi:hypothetical protein
VLGGHTVSHRLKRPRFYVVGLGMRKRLKGVDLVGVSSLDRAARAARRTKLRFGLAGETQRMDARHSARERTICLKASLLLRETWQALTVRKARARRCGSHCRAHRSDANDQHCDMLSKQPYTGGGSCQSTSAGGN